MRIPVVLLLAVLSCRILPAQDLTGYYKNFSIGMRLPRGTGADRSLWQISNRVRLKYSHKFGNDLVFDAAWEISPRLQDPIGPSISVPGSSPGAGIYRDMPVSIIIWTDFP